MWSLDPLRELGTLRGFLQGSDSVVFSPNGDRLAAGGGKEALKLYDSVSYQELLTLEAEGSNYPNTEFSPDGNVIGSRTVGHHAPVARSVLGGNRRRRGEGKRRRSSSHELISGSCPTRARICR